MGGRRCNEIDLVKGDDTDRFEQMCFPGPLGSAMED